MKARFDSMMTLINQQYDEIENTENRYLCILHHHNTLEEIKKLTQNDVLYTAAMLHDIGLYMGLKDAHAKASAEVAKKLMEKSALYSDDEIRLAYEVILVHSDKQQTHSFEAEMLKKADGLAHTKQ